MNEINTPEEKLILKARKLLSKFPEARAIYIMNKRLLSRLMRKLVGVTYNIDGITTIMNCDFMQDPEFIRSFNEWGKHGHPPNQGYWLAYVRCWAAFHAKKLKGDFVECGVEKGGSAISAMTYIDFKSLKNRKFYLFDTFCGLDKELSTQDEYSRYERVYPECYEEVVDAFKDYQNVVIVRGSVPKTLSKVNIRRVAYLHIDMNAALPEAEALKYFWSKLEPGGIIILDDYGQPPHENQKKAADDFASSVNVKVLSLPTGQGIIIKPPARK